MRGLNIGLNRIFLLVSIVMLFIFPIESAFCISDVERASSEIELAEEALGSAYLLVLKAERAGGDVSELVVLLNNGLDYLSGAKRAFSLGAYDGAVILAEEAVEVSNVVADDAVTLKGFAEHREEIMFRNKLFLSFGTAFFTVLLGYFGWRRFKEYYLRRTIGLRPEVSSDEP